MVGYFSRHATGSDSISSIESLDFDNRLLLIGSHDEDFFSELKDTSTVVIQDCHFALSVAAGQSSQRVLMAERDVEGLVRLLLSIVNHFNENLSFVFVCLHGD